MPDILTLPLSWHVAQKLWDFRFTSAAHEECFSHSQMWTTGGEQCSQVHLHTQITGTSARQEQIVSLQKASWIDLERSAVVLSGGKADSRGAVSCYMCFRGLQGWKTRVGWETWLCFTLVLQELPAVKCMLVLQKARGLMQMFIWMSCSLIPFSY